jgi:hypothetical protein
VGYVPLSNYNYDSGYKRIQSGPNNQGFIVLTSGSSAYGANEGVVVPGSPLAGNSTEGAWSYDSNWRYVPSTLPDQRGSLDPTPYNASGILDTYQAARIYTRDNVAGAQAASAIGPETGKVNPRGGALQPRANVTRPEKYMYFGGGAPDNQNYSPYNTPDANTAAEGKTGGGVTHRNYESTLLTNLLGSQGTSDRSQWRYHQPVYCKTFTETQRSATPGLMSSPLRYAYRGQATSYNYNYGSELLANKGGFDPIYLTEVPSTPSITSVEQKPNGCVILNFNPASREGSCPIENYEYSVDNGGTWIAFSPPLSESPVELCGIGTTYTEFSLRAVNCVGPSKPSDAVSNCVWSGVGISGVAVAGNTLTAPTICSNQNVTWYTYDSFTDTSNAVGSGNSIVVSNDYINKTLYTIQTCPDSSSKCSSVYVSGVGPATGFDPYEYEWVRVSGLSITLRDPGGLNIVSNWYKTKNLSTTYVIQLDMVENVTQKTILPIVPWRINNGLISLGNYVRSGFFGYLRIYGSDSSVAQVAAIMPLTSTFTPNGSIFARFEGVLQFSNNASTVLNSWIGE